LLLLSRLLLGSLFEPRLSEVRFLSPLLGRPERLTATRMSVREHEVETSGGLRSFDGPGAELALLARPERLAVVRKSAKKQHVDTRKGLRSFDGFGAEVGAGAGASSVGSAEGCIPCRYSMYFSLGAA
jgi:hypothetical protein